MTKPLYRVCSCVTPPFASIQTQVPVFPQVCRGGAPSAARVCTSTLPHLVARLPSAALARAAPILGTFTFAAAPMPAPPTALQPSVFGFGVTNAGPVEGYEGPAQPRETAGLAAPPAESDPSVHPSLGNTAERAKSVVGQSGGVPTALVMRCVTSIVAAALQAAQRQPTHTCPISSTASSLLQVALGGAAVGGAAEGSVGFDQQKASIDDALRLVGILAAFPAISSPFSSDQVGNMMGVLVDAGLRQGQHDEALQEALKEVSQFLSSFLCHFCCWMHVGGSALQQHSQRVLSHCKIVL